MATETIPTTITPEVAALAKEYGVERELQAILDKGREMVAGLRGLEVEAEPSSDMGERCIVVTAEIDPVFQGDQSHVDWWSWRIEQYGVKTASLFLVCFSTTEG